MAENRKTFTIREDEEKGTVKIADEVVAIVAGLAATEVKGVRQLSGGITNAQVSRIGLRALSKGLRISVTDNVVSVETAIEIDYGCSIPEVSRKVQERVKSAIENMTGMTVADIDVHVTNVAMEEES